MTENKRYTSDIHRIYDDNEEIACADTMDDAQDIVDLLNKQEERIKRIEKYINREIKQREEDLDKTIKVGMPTGSLYSEIELLEEIQKIINEGDTND